MDRIVAVLEQEADGRIQHATTIDRVVMGTIMLNMILRGGFVLHPTAQKLSTVLELG